MQITVSSTVPTSFVLLPPATTLGQGYVFTGVCDSVHRGVSASVHAGIPSGAYIPLGADTPGADTPSSAEHAGRYGKSTGGTHPTGMQTCIFIFKKNDQKSEKPSLPSFSHMFYCVN